MSILRLLRNPIKSYRAYKLTKEEFKTLGITQRVRVKDVEKTLKYYERGPPTNPATPTSLDEYYAFMERHPELWNTEEAGFVSTARLKEIEKDPKKAIEELKLKYNIKATVVPVVATQAPTATATKKTLATKYKPFNKDLIKNLTDILNTLPASEARNELIRKIERMDIVKLNELYWEKPDLFNVYFAYDSDAYTDGLEYEGDDEGLGGYGDLIRVYEERYGEI